jgi:hypothetical protein
MKPNSSFLSAMLSGGMVLVVICLAGCTATRAVGEPSGETANPPAVDQASIQAMGPPPGYVKPENCWVREKVILTSAPEPSAPATSKKTVKKTMKDHKTSK